MYDTLTIGPSHIVVAALVNIAIGALWYSPVLFGNIWMKLMGLSKEKMQGKSAMQSMGINALATLFATFVLAHFASPLESSSGGALLGFWVAIGFITPALLNSVLWEGKPWKLFAINALYPLIAYPIMGAILTV